MLGFFISIWVIFIDTPLLEPNYRMPYILGRVITAGICLVVAATNLRRQYRWQVPLLFMTLVTYSAHGQFFLPCYYLAYMEVIIPLGLFFQIPQKQFYSMILGSLAVMLWMIIYSAASYSTDPQVTLKFKFDASMGVIITTILSVLGYNYITRNRQEREILMEKFLDLGCHTSSIMHDLKGLLTTPITYVEVLNDKLEKVSNQDRQLGDVLSFLKDDLLFLNQYVNEINSLNHLNEEVGWFQLSEVVEVVQTILQGSLKEAALETKSDTLLYFNKSVLTKVLYNVVMNSIEAKQQKDKLKIEIAYRQNDRSIMICDNGSGFPKDTLKDLNSGRLVTSEKKNGGIGIYLIRRLLESRNGAIRFKNSPSGGACVQVQLPQPISVPERDRVS
jgi:signal transduction histidine kinase